MRTRFFTVIIGMLWETYLLIQGIKLEDLSHEIKESCDGFSKKMVECQLCVASFINLDGL